MYTVASPDPNPMGGGQLFYLVNLNLVSRPMWISN